MQLNIFGNKEQLREKASELIKQRGLVDFVDILTIDKVQKDIIIQKLLTLQTHIFDLDAFGEKNRDIKEGKNNRTIQELWSQIKTDLKKDFRLSETAIRSSLQNINDFMTMELEMRKGKSPTEIDGHTFYAMKICDVQLQRKLIEGELGKHIENSGRDTLDMLGEIIDDIDDLEEDLLSNNSNRLLICLEIAGYESTEKEYMSLAKRLVTEYFSSQDIDIQLGYKIIEAAKEISDKLITIKIFNKRNETSQILYNILSRQGNKE
ncbi:MAG: hypothetical protein NTX91_01745 [candidate division SR1 bacterium]|nr:hypothetical protein [candidate division SR1 bacterium]